jgi:hypothetical protein
MIPIKRKTLATAWLCLGACALAVKAAVPLPMQETVENSARYRWENKPVLASRLLDDAEKPATWAGTGTAFSGEQSAGSEFGEMSFSRERAKDGVQSVRVHSKTTGDRATKNGRPWGYVSAVRKVDGEDWSQWNRISLWVYPDLPGHKTVSIYLDIHNNGDGTGKGGERARDNILLKNQQWNHVVSEIEYFQRDKVTSVAIRCRLHGNEPGTSETMTYYIDQLELQRVEPDHYQGWSVAPGSIAFSHTGYPVGSPKSALASDLSAKEFKLINADTKKTVLSKPVKTMTNPTTGKFQVMDFTEMRTPGTYYIEAGDRKTRTFRIDDNVWSNPLAKAINFFYTERCGTVIPGVHDVCHVDWIAHNGDKHVSINGGWHDAGDLSQGLYNTAEATRTMFELAERMQAKGQDLEFCNRIIEEATWGLDWLLKTAAIEGQRPNWLVNGWWSDNEIGSADDNKARVTTGASPFLTAAAAEAVASRVLKQSAPAQAATSLSRAQKDWGYAMERLDKDLAREATCEAASAAVVAGIELFRATGERLYADKALELAPRLVASQERNYLPGSRKISGFLYAKPDGKGIIHSVTPGARELAQITALVKLCETFPENSNWMQWYGGVALYSEYFYQRVADVFEPYGYIPGGIYQCDEWKNTWESNQPKMKEAIQNGCPVSDGYVVRAFPPSSTGFGTTHVNLTQAALLAQAAHLRGDLKSALLAERQLEWALGRNPFSQSLMYGEGYDYVPQYNPMCGNMVGAMPVGLGARADDKPYWPAGNNEPSRKEMWVQTVARFINLAGNLNGPALVEGRSLTGVEFADQASGAVTRITPDADGGFRAFLPEGEYVVRANGFERRMTLLPNGTHKFDPSLDFSVSSTTSAPGQVLIEVEAQGTGSHNFSIRTENLTVSGARQTLTLKPGQSQKVTWKGQINEPNGPWFVVVIPDNDLSQRKEVLDRSVSQSLALTPSNMRVPTVTLK